MHEFRELEDVCTAINSMLKRLVLFIAFLMMLVVVGVASAQRVSPQACMAVADMVLTARGMAEHSIPKDKAQKVMASIYAELTDKTAVEVRLKVTDWAYRAKGTALELTREFVQMCQMTGGNLTPILGSDA